MRQTLQSGNHEQHIAATSTNQSSSAENGQSKKASAARPATNESQNDDAPSWIRANTSIAALAELATM